jgi:hypothetical protein
MNIRLRGILLRQKLEQDGIDGRNRSRACEIAEVEPRKRWRWR